MSIFDQISVCEWCKKKFTVADNRQRRFCRLECCWAWRRANKEKVKGAFKPGITPWNTGTKGVMQPNSGSFQKGRENERKQPIGAVCIRTQKGDGQRAWVKIADNGTSYDWKYRAVVVWESIYGPVPSGYVVHHKDRNKLNDAIENLELMSRAQHLLEHRHEHEERRKHAAAKAKHRANRSTVRKTTPAPKGIFP